jgi:hypothetical protein
MQVHRLGIKFFVADPSEVSLRDFIPIFHTWIQRQSLPGHLLVDVHDYSHIHNGPGILLVSHEGNFSIDMAESRPGLLYTRKQPAADFSAIVTPAVQACRLLEQEPGLKIRFRTDELLIIGNDRLHAPNDEETFSRLQPVLSSALKEVLGQPGFKITRIENNPKERLTIQAKAARPD